MTDLATASAQTADADRAEALRDLRTATRLINTMLARFTDHDTVVANPWTGATESATRTEWVPDHVVAEWRSIAKAVQDGAL